MRIMIKDQYDAKITGYNELEKFVLWVLLNKYQGEMFISVSLAIVKIDVFTPFDRLVLADRLIAESWMDNDFDNSKI